VTTVRADTRLNGVLDTVEILKDDAKRVRVAGMNMAVWKKGVKLVLLGMK
jgi:hypothetical protein